jgi:hypothetical protein
MVITVSHSQYREGLTKQNEPADQCLAKHVARTQGFASRVWSDQELKQITSESDARFLYGQSTTLQKEFSHCDTFVAYWRNLGRVK